MPPTQNTTLKKASKQRISVFSLRKHQNAPGSPQHYFVRPTTRRPVSTIVSSTGPRSDIADSTASSPSIVSYGSPGNYPSSAPLSPERSTIPGLPNDLNPFLLPPAKFPPRHLSQPPQTFPHPSYGPSSARSVPGAWPDPDSRDQSRDQSREQSPDRGKRKKGESRVVFSDEASVFSNTETDISEARSTLPEVSDFETSDTDGTSRPPSRGSRTDSSMASSYLSRSASVPAQRKRAQTTKMPHVQLAKLPSQKLVTQDDDSSSEDNILSSITDAIPNLHLLLEKYKKAHGQIEVRQKLARKLEARFQAVIQTKDDTIQRLMGQAEDAARARADENGKLKNRVDELQSTNINLTAEVTTMKEKILILEQRAKSAEADKEDMRQVNDMIRKEKREFTEAAKDDKEKSMAAMSMRLLNEFAAEKNSMHASFNEDVEELQTAFEKEKRTMVEEYNEMKSSLKGKISSQEKRLEELDQSHTEIEENVGKKWSDEKSKIKADHEEVKDNLQKTHDEEKAEAEQRHQKEIEDLRVEHQQKINDQIRGFVDLQERLNKAYVIQIDDLQQQLGNVQLALPAPPPPPSVEDESPDDMALVVT